MGRRRRSIQQVTYINILSMTTDFQSLFPWILLLLLLLLLCLRQLLVTPILERTYDNSNHISAAAAVGRSPVLFYVHVVVVRDVIPENDGRPFFYTRTNERTNGNRTRAKAHRVHGGDRPPSSSST